MTRNILILGSAFWLSISRAHAVQISLSDINVDRYFQILEQYVLPLMVVSTVVLFCGYLASRLYHRTVSRKDEKAAGRGVGTADDETEAFLRELKATPPIEDHEPALLAPRPEAASKSPAPTADGKPRPSHPLLRRRAAARAAEARQMEIEPEPAPVMRPASSPVAEPAARREAPPVQEPRRSAIPRLQDAFRRPRDDAAPTNDRLDDEPAPYVAPTAHRARPAAEPPRAPLLRADPATFGRERAPLSEDGDFSPTPARAPGPERDGDTPPRREEPTISVVQALKRSSTSMAAESETARARAGEIVDSLDYIASILQQASALVAERHKNRQRMSLDDVRELRISGFDEPQNVLEDLRKLGGDAAQEVLAAYASVAGFNKIARRLEQMAEAEPLDEGWNDLVRTRLSDTIYTVGQVRKTLGIYRRVVKKPANSEAKPGAAGGTQ